jgi:hypothetical protein
MWTELGHLHHDPWIAVMRRDLAHFHWPTLIANKSYLFQHTCFLPCPTTSLFEQGGGRGGWRGQMTASTTNAMFVFCHATAHHRQLYSTCQPAGKHQTGFMQLKRTNQCRGLAVSRPPQQPLHRLTRFANHASRSSLPILEGRGQRDM